MSVESTSVFVTPIERCSIFIVPQIIDNIALKMQPVLQTALRTSVVFDASVGYFNLRGWSALLDAVDNLPGRSGRPTARLLIGMRQQTAQDELKEVAWCQPAWCQPVKCELGKC